jgi:hypothetical protein
MAQRASRSPGLKITVLVEGKTERAFKPHLLRFLKVRLDGSMPNIDFFPCDGRIYKEESSAGLLSVYSRTERLRPTR